VCDRVTLFIVDPVRNELECRVSKDSTGWRIPIGKGLAGECAATGETFNIKVGAFSFPYSSYSIF
jgi:hypothetical protein